MLDMDVSAVAVVELYQDVLVVIVGADHGAGVEVAELTAPVHADPPAQPQLGDSLRADFHYLDRR